MSKYKKVQEDEEEDFENTMQSDNQQVGSTSLNIYDAKGLFNHSKSNPEEIFRDHCERYARINLHKEVIPIELFEIDVNDEAT